ncbi:hypothetical protein HZS_5755 [Henneguya salminicola]|nr:hypothetical protein HZS_5755 [Henneguya salminicola]
MTEINWLIPRLSDLLETDPNLNFFQRDIELRLIKTYLFLRYENFKNALDEIKQIECGGLDEFSKSYSNFGLHILSNGVVKVREWVPGAAHVSLIGDFSIYLIYMIDNWDEEANPLKFCGFGRWECFIMPLKHDEPVIHHLSKYKLCITTPNNCKIYRLSPWSAYTVQNETTKLFESYVWNPPIKYIWKNDWPLKRGPPIDNLRIYEAHIGISSEEYKVASYTYFKNNVIPHILYLGYNTLQLMAIVEHAYYASFGYQVTSFFAVSSRFGTPDELKELIDACHNHGIRVLLDIVHGHACKNTEDGLNKFDGTDGCFFHENYRGYHNLWDSRLFDYSKLEVKRFLLSNLRWYLDEYHFDGFRFDGVTSMLYHHHGASVGFSGDYKEYFGMQVDLESTAYIQLANYMLKQYYPHIIIIAEEVSGMPALCRSIEEGGFGFDYRLAMAIPDMWIKVLKEKKDEDWNMWDIIWSLINRRHGEKHVAYAESHDQALVGDKTLAFWLMDAQMYWNMSFLEPKNLIIDRGIALHKMIRLITMGLGGEAYLTFMGNEFGHPEWLDFPRAGNNNSYHHARRQWHLVHEPVSKHHQEDKIISFERGSLLWVFNFHPTNSYVDYRIPLSKLTKLLIYNLKIVIE